MQYRSTHPLSFALGICAFILHTNLGSCSITITYGSNGVLYYVGLKKKRCGTCSGCKSSDCGTCQFCRDKPKFGGPGRKKKCCEKRKCENLLTIDEVRMK